MSHKDGILVVFVVLLAASMLAGIGTSPSAWAQEDEPTTGAATAEAAGARPVATPIVMTGEFVVSARRVEEELQDVPVSISVVSGDEIIQRAIVDFTGLAFQVPNVLVTENGNRPGQTGVTIRGVPGRTGIYMDDVFVGDSSANNVLMMDVARVEVLRGPQGTLFGRNSIAGTINTITNKPSTSSWFTDVLLRGGDYGYSQANVSVTGPLAKDRVGFSLAAGYRARDGYETTVSGLNVNEENSYAARAKLYFTPNENVSLLITGDYHTDDSRVGYGDAIDDFGFFGMFYQHAAQSGEPYDRVVADRNLEGRTDRDVYGLSASLDWIIGDLLFESITGYRGSSSDNFRDGDGGPADIVTGNQPVDYESFSQEFRLSGGSSAIDWQVGAYYFRDKREFTDFVRLGPDFIVAAVPELAPIVGNPFGIVTIGGLYSSPLLQQIIGLVPPTPYGDRSTFNRNEIESLASYGSLTWHAADTLDLTFGARYTDETINGAYSQNGVAWSPIDPDIPLTELEASDDDISPLLSVVYMPSENVSLYGTTSRGFQSGGFNLAPGSTPAEERLFKPEKVTNYELGLKNTFANGKVFTTFALFMMKYQDFQRSQSRATTEGQITTTYNTDATVEGFEIELSSSPANGLNLSAGVGYQKSTYDDYPGAPVNTRDGLVILDLTGEQLPFVPEWSASLVAMYDFPISNALSMQLGGDLQYRSDYQVNNGPDPLLKVDATNLLNAEVGIRFDKHALVLRARVQNILDEEYITSLDFNNLSGAAIVDLSPPMTFFVELRKYF